MKKSDLSEDAVRIGVSEKIAYGCGDMASKFLTWTLRPFQTYYLSTDIYGLGAGAMALLIFTIWILDGISDFCMGAIADRTNTRFGKFRPYLLWFSLPLAFASVLTFTTLHFEDMDKLIYAFVTYNLLIVYLHRNQYSLFCFIGSDDLFAG